MAKKIQKSDFEHISEFIMEEKETRGKNRKDLDRDIKEIDRQVAMTPKTDHKMIVGDDGRPTNRRDPRKAWLPEIELPLQAEALEILTSDSRALQFPDAGPWFRAHAALTDEYLRNADFQAMVTGDENEVPSEINQDNADKLVEGYINHLHRQYDFFGHIDVINAESIAYGVGVGRARMVEKTVFMQTSRGVTKQDQKIPVLVPRSIKNTYLDDREHSLMHEGYMTGPMTIFTRKMPLEELMRWAKGNTDPNKQDGGWIVSNVKNLEADKDGMVELLEAEGDFVIPRKTTGDMFLPGEIFTIAIGKNDNKVIRVQHRQFPFNSVLTFPYHKEKVDSVYATSPLRKGLPLQLAAVEALMRLAEVSALNSFPPIGYDRMDQWFAQMGGPVVEPGAQWGTISDIQVHKIGDVNALLASYNQFLSQYADVVGTQRARLGAQTVSHTTAFAKNAELQRGQVRTVDYVRSTLKGPLAQWLDMCYRMGRENFKKEQTFYIDAYRGFVTLNGKEMLPETVVFEAFGSGAPAEEQANRQRRLESLRFAFQIDAANIQTGGKPALDRGNIIEQVLQEGGWIDIDPMLLDIAPQPGQPDPEGNIPNVQPIRTV